MATGPSLKQLHAHQAIHHGGIAGAIQKTGDLIETLKIGDLHQANAVLDDLLDYWETRIIAHADSEESGFYQEIEDKDPAKHDVITALKRDHELMKMIIADIHQLRQEEGLSHEVMRKLQALIVVNEIHSRDEERLLFD